MLTLDGHLSKTLVPRTSATTKNKTKHHPRRSAWARSRNFQILEFIPDGNGVQYRGEEDDVVLKRIENQAVRLTFL